MLLAKKKPFKYMVKKMIVYKNKELKGNMLKDVSLLYVELLIIISFTYQ